VVLKAFDLLKLDGEDVEGQPLLERKELLSKLLGDNQTFQYVPHSYDLQKCWEQVVARGEEGLILKDINSRYEHERSYKWLKIKNWRYETCTVVGYTAGDNARKPFFGSLVLADQNGKFRGCVGSGFSDWELRQIKDLFTDAEKISRPFDIGEPWIAANVRLQVQVQYYKSTEKNGLLRHPVFVKIV